MAGFELKAAAEALLRPSYFAGVEIHGLHLGNAGALRLLITRSRIQVRY